MIVIIATVLALFVVCLLQENAEPTKNKARQLFALIVLIASAILYSLEYGTLRGIFILIGVLSLLGTLFTLLRYKFNGY